MKGSQIAHRLRILFEQKITAEYFALFKGCFGRVQVDVLNHLYAHHATRLQEISDTLNIPKQHASKIIQRLGEQGLVTKSVDPLDGRALLFSLTDKGFQLMKKQVAASDSLFEERLRALSHEDREMMLRAMEQMVVILEKL